MSNFPEGASGDFASWSEAAKLCSFDRAEFQDKVLIATLAVARGAAVHVRDGYIFDSIVYSWPLLAGLMYAAARSKEPLVVLDFGGSLGVTYFQNRRFLDRLDKVEWHIVERDIYCDLAAREEIHPRLRFHRSIEACVESGVVPTVVILSSVLQFLPDPWSLLDEVRKLPIRHVLIDRCPINARSGDRLTVFRAPITVAEDMTRPMWFFEEARLLAALGSEFQLIESFASFEHASGVPSSFKGYIFERAVG